MLHAEDILKGEAMISGPSCPLRLGVIDSPDYWTDDALMSAVRPLNPDDFTTWPLDPNNEGINSAVFAPPVHSIPATERSLELMKRRNQLVDPGA